MKDIKDLALTALALFGLGFLVVAARQLALRW